MKLALGTAQFGMPYGVTNATGQPKAAEVENILNYAASKSINLLDTAKLYGNSEQLLGTLLKGSGSFQFITKTPKIEASLSQKLLMKQVQKDVQDSMDQLQAKALYAVLLHDAGDLLSEHSDDVYHALEQLKAEGKVHKIGISAYSPEDVELVIQRYPIDIVQMPFNLLDQRAESSGLLKKLQSKRVEVHIRSVFLQGVLLSDINALPAQFDGISQQLTALEELSACFNVPKMAIALDFLKQHSAIDRIIVGVLNQQQLSECLSAYEKILPESIDYQSFRCTDTHLVDPRRWQ